MDDVQTRKEDRDQRLKEVPLRRADEASWPKGIRAVGVVEVDALGVDNKGGLYWHGKEIEFRRKLDLTWAQFWIAVVVAGSTAVAAIGAAVQGWAAYHDWACKVGWRTWGCSPPSQAVPSPPSQAAPPPSIIQPYRSR